MKNGKTPTYSQRKILMRNDLDAHEWLVVKNTSTELVIVNRNDGCVKVVMK